MHTKNGNLHLEIQTSRKNPVGILRTSFRDKLSGKIKHSQHGRITGCSLGQLKILQLAFRQKVVPTHSDEAFRILSSREFGASFSVLSILKQLGLHKIIYSRNEPWVNDVVAMIVGRLVYAGSKLSLCNHFANTCLWQLCSGITGKVDVQQHCYYPMDRLMLRQQRIQTVLANKHLKEGHLVLYDITSSYFEGEYRQSQLVKYGYNRDKKKGHEQICIGLICSSEGCPVGVEVFAGNTKDETTVIEQIEKLKQQYGLAKIIFVGDRGMVTQSNLSKFKQHPELFSISALTHKQMQQLLEKEVVQIELFDEREIHEVVDVENPGQRYCLCQNPYTAKKSRQTRRRLMQLTKEGLIQIGNYKRKTTVEKLGARVGKLLSKYKLGKYVKWEIKGDNKAKTSIVHELIWEWDEEKIKEESQLDGCYIIRTDLNKEEMNAQQVVCSYKKLELVETAFRNLKTVQLEMRPIYHKRDDRIQAHVFLCVLAYYVEWHMHKRLKKLFDEDGNGKDRRWTFAGVIDSLKQICSNKVKVNDVEFYQNTEPNEEQKKILELLDVKL